MLINLPKLQKIFSYIIFMTDPNQDIITLCNVINNLPKYSIVIFRHFNLNNKQQLGKQLRLLTKKNRIKLFVSADINLAQQLNADGIHLPENSIKNNIAKYLLWQQNTNKKISLSVHSNIYAIKRAQTLKLDFILISPIFYTNSHPDDKPLTINRLKCLLPYCHNKVIALGGINQLNSQHLSQAGVDGMAAISLFLAQK